MMSRQLRRIWAWSPIIVTILCYLLSTAWEVQAQGPALKGSLATDIIKGTNSFRARQGVPKLKTHPALKKAAEMHSMEMAKMGYFSHRSPTPGRTKVRNRVEAQKITPKRVAENIANCYGFPIEQVSSYFVSTWLDSSGHRANMVNPKHTHVGVGVAKIGDKFYATQVFAGGDLNFQKAHVDPNGAKVATRAEDIAKKVFELTNQRRRDANLPEFTTDAFLAQAAYDHSEEMLRLNYFSHRSPTPGRTKVRDRVRRTGAEPYRLAENLYQCEGYKPETVALRATLSWMQSPGHRANILDSRLNKLGVGIYFKNGSYYVTQVFSGDS